MVLRALYDDDDVSNGQGPDQRAPQHHGTAFLDTIIIMQGDTDSQIHVIYYIIDRQPVVMFLFLPIQIDIGINTRSA